MFQVILGFLKSLFGATKAVSSELKQRDAEQNTPSQQSNAEAKQIQQDKAKAAQDIADPDLDQLRKDVAE